MTGAKEPGPRGEHDISRKPLRGECRAFSGASAVKLVCILQLQSAHEAAGALGTRSSLRPLISRGWFAPTPRAHSRCGNAASRLTSLKIESGNGALFLSFPCRPSVGSADGIARLGQLD